MRDLGGLVTIKDTFHLGAISLSDWSGNQMSRRSATREGGFPVSSRGDWTLGRLVVGAPPSMRPTPPSTKRLVTIGPASRAAEGRAMSVSEAVDGMRTEADELLGR